MNGAGGVPNIGPVSGWSTAAPTLVGLEAANYLHQVVPPCKPTCSQHRAYGSVRCPWHLRRPRESLFLAPPALLASYRIDVQQVVDFTGGYDPAFETLRGKTEVATCPSSGSPTALNIQVGSSATWWWPPDFRASFSRRCWFGAGRTLCCTSTSWWPAMKSMSTTPRDDLPKRPCGALPHIPRLRRGTGCRAAPLIEKLGALKVKRHLRSAP